MWRSWPYGAARNLHREGRPDLRESDAFVQPEAASLPMMHSHNHRPRVIEAVDIALKARRTTELFVW